MDATDARHQALFTLMPSGAIVIAEDGTFLEFNEQAHETLGYSREEFAALTLSDLDAADTRGEFADRLRRLAAGELLEFEGSFRSRSGELRDVMIRARSAEGWDRRAVLVTFLDLTPRRRAEDALRTAHRAVLALSRCNEMLVRSTTEHALYEQLCRLVVEDGGYRTCWVGLAEQDERRSVRAAAVAGYDDGFVAGLGVVWADVDLGRGPTGTAIRTGRPSVGRDFAADPNLAPWKAAALHQGYRSVVALPLVSEGRAFGAVA